MSSSYNVPGQLLLQGSVGRGEELEVAFQDIDKNHAEEYNYDNDDGDQQEEYVLGRISITMIKIDLFTSCVDQQFSIYIIFLTVKVLHNGSLVLWRVGLQDRGDYTCKAANQVPDCQNKNAILISMTIKCCRLATQSRRLSTSR